MSVAAAAAVAAAATALPPLPRVLSKHKNELELAALYAPLIVLSEVLLYREKVHSIRRAWKKVQCQEHQSDAWRIDTWTMKMDYESMHSIYIRTALALAITLEDLLLCNRNKLFLGEHKVITPKQQFLGIVLCFFMYFKWPWLLRFFAKML